MPFEGRRVKVMFGTLLQTNLVKGECTASHSRNASYTEG